MAGEEHRPLTVEAMRENLRRLPESRHGHCVVCGSRNPEGLHLKFLVQPDGQIETTFPCNEIFQGFRGRLHGGVIALLLDAAMTHCVFAHGIDGVTGELNVRFHRPVGTDEPARVRAWIEKSTSWLHLLRAEIIQDEVVRAVASGKFAWNGTPPSPQADS